MTETVREAVGVFDSADALEDAIDDLMRHGFDRADISLLASEHAVEESLGHRYRRVEEIEDDPNAARTSYVSRQAAHEAEGAAFSFPLYVGAMTATGIAAAAGGPIGAVVAAAAIGGGAGGLIGAILSTLIADEHAARIEEQVARGGLVVWVHVRDAGRESRALELLSEHGARDIHVHDVPASALDR